MFILFSIILALGVFLFSDSIRNVLSCHGQKKRATLGLFSGIALSAISLCLFALL